MARPQDLPRLLWAVDSPNSLFRGRPFEISVQAKADMDSKKSNLQQDSGATTYVDYSN